jgi:hypothetical protein
MSDGQGVLTEQHLADIQKAMDNLNEAERQIKLARQAGLDTGAYETELKKTREQLTALKQTYFPNR